MKKEQPVTGNAFREALGRAIAQAEARKASKDSCPACRTKLALLTISFRGLKLGYMCRICDHTSFDGRFAKSKKAKRSESALTVKGRKVRRRRIAGRIGGRLGTRA